MSTIECCCSNIFDNYIISKNWKLYATIDYMSPDFQDYPHPWAKIPNHWSSYHPRYNCLCFQFLSDASLRLRSFVQICCIVSCNRKLCRARHHWEIEHQKRRSRELEKMVWLNRIEPYLKWETLPLIWKA